MTTPVSNIQNSSQTKAEVQTAASLDERHMLRKLQNEQIIIYLIICFVIIVAWILGSWQFSFVWIVGIAFVTLIIWCNKVVKLTERNIQHREAALHRRQSLRENESAEWLNFLLNRWWMFSSADISDVLRKHLNPRLNNGKPAYIDHIVIQSINLNGGTPAAKFIHVYECTTIVGGVKVPVTWETATSPPGALSRASQYQLILEINLALTSEECAMVLDVRLGRKWLGMSLNVAVEKLYVKGPLQMILQMNRDMPFPHIASIALSFQEKPEISFGVRMLKIFDIMEAPLVMQWINHIVRRGIFEAIVEPGKFLIDLRDDNTPAIVAPSTPSKDQAEGVLSVILRFEFITPNAGNKKAERKASIVDDTFSEAENETRVCVMRLGTQTAQTVALRGRSTSTAAASFLVSSTKQDKFFIKLKSTFVLASQTMATFEFALKDLKFDGKENSCELVLERQIDRIFGGETVRVSISTKLHKLPNFNQILDRGRVKQDGSSAASGVVSIRIHAANDLISIDKCNLSNPYCLAYYNGKRVACTHFVKKTNSPQWEVSAEFLVEDISRGCLLFAVYNWNGQSAVDDEFLGATQVLLSADEPVLIRKIVDLVNNLFGSTQLTNAVGGIGQVHVSAVFHPVPAIAVASSSASSVSVDPVAQQALTSDLSRKVSRKSPRPSSRGTVLLHIIRAKDLTPMDSNGSSDPFCEVLVNEKKVYKTSRKKQTLEPVWDESPTIDLPQPNETLKIMMYDHDMLSSNDFLGTVSFTLDDLQKMATNVQHDGWFPLQQAVSGSIQLRVQVFQNDSNAMNDSAAINVIRMQHDTEAVFAAATQNTQKTASNEVSDKVPSDGKNDGEISATADIASPVSGELTLVNKDASEENDSAGGSVKLQRKLPGASTVKRAGSVGQVYRPSPGGIDESNRKQGDGIQRPTTNFGFSPKTQYRGVRGVLRAIKGVPDSVTSIYCKIRLNSFGGTERLRKSSSSLVLAKSESLLPAARLELDLKFEIDHGHGVDRTSLLVFDIKSGHFSHVATRGYTLQELLGDDGKPFTAWLLVDGTVEIKVHLTCDGLLEARQSVIRRSHGILTSFRGLKKIKEN